VILSLIHGVLLVQKRSVNDKNDFHVKKVPYDNNPNGDFFWHVWINNKIFGQMSASSAYKELTKQYVNVIIFM